VNPELQAKLVAYLGALEKGAEKVGDFAEREIPATIHEWLVWLAVERFAYAALFLVGMLVAFFGIRWLARLSYSTWDEFRKTEAYTKFQDDSNWNGWLALTILQVTATGLLSIGLIYWSMQAVKVIVAPRVVIVEKVAELVSSNKPK